MTLFSAVCLLLPVRYRYSSTLQGMLGRKWIRTGWKLVLSWSFSVMFDKRKPFRELLFHKLFYSEIRGHFFPTIETIKSVIKLSLCNEYIFFLNMYLQVIKRKWNKGLRSKIIIEIQNQKIVACNESEKVFPKAMIFLNHCFKAVRVKYAAEILTSDESGQVDKSHFILVHTFSALN